MGSRKIAVFGLLAVVLYAALAAVQILVLNPLAAAPGRSLQHVYADVAVAGETMAPAVVLVILGIGVAVAIYFVVRASRSPGWSSRGVAVAFATLVMFGAPAYFWASFGPGMSLADTYLIGGADHSPWAAPLYAASAVATVALILLLALGRAERQVVTPRP